MPNLTTSRCNQCGQTDDHPKVILSTEGVFHHDCLSADLRSSMVEGSPQVAEIIEAAEGGIHGDDLREFIVSSHETTEA